MAGPTDDPAPRVPPASVPIVLCGGREDGRVVYVPPAILTAGLNTAEPPPPSLTMALDPSIDGTSPAITRWTWDGTRDRAGRHRFRPDGHRR